MSARKFWRLDPGVLFLNHGSFGACPQPVLEEQQRWRERMERQPVRFFVRELPDSMAAARAALAAFVGADADHLAFVPNATAGINAVLRSLRLRPGDEILVTDHAYNAVRCAASAVAQASGASLRVAAIPFPVSSPDQVVESLLRHVTERTRLAIVDHVTSPTALVFPIERIVGELERRGVDVLVDGAHAPGLVPVDLRAIGAAYYVANCHKWLCAPKGAGFLYVRPDRQEGIHPVSISHGWDAPLAGRTRFRAEFDWTGTFDPSAVLCVPTAIEFVGSLHADGWDGVRARNRAVALDARRRLCETLGIEPPAPEEMIAAMASVPLPESGGGLEERLAAHGIEVPVITWPPSPWRLLRISAHVYNEPGEYERLAAALGAHARQE